MEGMRGSNQGIDVTRSLSLSRASKEGEFSGASVTQSDVTRSLSSHLRPAPFDCKALEKFKVTLSMGSNVQLFAKLAVIEEQEQQIRDKGI